MKKLFVVLVGILLLNAFSALDAFAAGYGFYAEGGSGSGEMTVEYTIGEFDVDADVSHVGGGFMMDTSVSSESIFNYRFHVGYESLTITPDGSSIDTELDGLVMMHDFGFALVKTPQVRFWAGPEVKLGYYKGETSDGADDINNMTLFGLGPVVGLNIGVSQSVFLAFKLGYLYTGFVGEGENAFETYDFSGNANIAYVNAGLLF